MTETSSNDSETVRSSNASSRFARRLAILSFSCGLVAFLLFGINAFGFNLFLYVNVGGNDAIFGASTGVLHAATAPHTDMTVSANDQLISGSGQFDPYAMSGIQTDLIVAGPVHLFSERRLDRLQPLRFDASNNNGYMAIELPMILLALIPATFGCLLMRHARKYNLTQTRDGG